MKERVPEAGSLLVILAKVPDPRLDRTKRHLLGDILVCTVCATLCGAEGWVDVELWAKSNERWLKTFLELPNGIPSHDTFGRVFSILDPDAFRAAFLEWVKGIGSILSAKHFAVDGKTPRGSRFASENPIHIVSAWAREAQLVVGQVKVDDKSNEITAIPKLLELLDLSGGIVTIDAMGCQKEIAAKITSKGADYILALKENQPSAFAAVSEAFTVVTPKPNKSLGVTAHHTEDKKHGRMEHRAYTVMPAPEHLALRGWPELHSVVRVKRTRFVGESCSIQTHYYLSSLSSSAKAQEPHIRGHWTIENQLHWCLDVQFNEDKSRIRKDHAPENAAIIRHFALNLIKQDKTRKVGMKAKMKLAGWDREYLLTLLNSATS